ncbi:MAG: YlxR family protein [Kofleriaceae bacterium]
MSHDPKRTCTGCRTIESQHLLVRVGVSDSLVMLDRARRLPGRGAYVHARTECVTAAGLSRSLKRSVTPKDVQRLVRDLSPTADNSSDLQGKNPSGLAEANAVETPSGTGWDQK